MAKLLQAADVERLENTSFASAFAQAAPLGEQADTLAFCGTAPVVCGLLTGPFTHYHQFCGVSNACESLECQTIPCTTAVTMLTCEQIQGMAGAPNDDAALIEAVREA